MPKQLINIIGAVITIAVIVAGVLLVGFPVFTQAQSTEQESSRVETSNRAQAAVLEQLRATNVSALDTELRTLRTRIPDSQRAGDVLRAAFDAAAQGGGIVKSVDVGPMQPFAQRTAELGGNDAPIAEPAPENVAATGPEQQFSVTVTFEGPHAAAVIRMQEAMTNASRLVVVTDSNLTSDDEKSSLVVELLAFVWAAAG